MLPKKLKSLLNVFVCARFKTNGTLNRVIIISVAHCQDQLPNFYSMKVLME